MSEIMHLCGFECVFQKKTDVREFFSFANIGLDHHYFSVVDAAVFAHGKRIDVLEKIPVSSFEELIRQSFVGERLVLHLYPENADSEEIDTYQDYINSNCEMIVLLYDFFYMEIYCKNKAWIKQLMHTARNMHNTVVEEKYEESDTRTVMYV